MAEAVWTPGAGWCGRRGARLLRRRACPTERGEALDRLRLDRGDGRRRLGRPGPGFEVGDPLRRQPLLRAQLPDVRQTRRLRTGELRGARGRGRPQPGEPGRPLVQRAEQMRDLGAGVPRLIDHVLRGGRRPAQIVEPGDQLVEGRRAEDDREHVGAVPLVERTQLSSQVPLSECQRAPRDPKLAVCGRPVTACPGERGLDVGELTAGPVETRVQRIELEQRRLLARRQRGPRRTETSDPVRAARGRKREEHECAETERRWSDDSCRRSQSCKTVPQEIRS